MSVIAVENVPIQFNLKRIVNLLQKPIRGRFEALNFGKSKNSRLMKTCYLRLSQTLDPVEVVQNINNYSYTGKGTMCAFIPDNVPDMQIGKSKKNRVPAPILKKIRIAAKNAGGKIIDFTTHEIMSELQAKYPGIVALSAKYNHKLLKDIAKVIHERVSVLVSQFPELEESCFKSTKAYRRAHPHFGDFQLVLSTLHAVQDAAGIPREQLQESDITQTPRREAKSCQQGPEMPIELVRSYCQKYIGRITMQMTEYVKGLEVIPHQMDTEEDKARKRIRKELKKLQPFLPQIVSEVVNTQCLPEENKFRQVRIYGEPYLPNRETLMPFLARFKPKRPRRSINMFNMFMLSVPPAVYKQLLEKNGTVINGNCKLVIVASDSVRSHPWKTGADGEEQSEEENTDEDEEEQEIYD